jgi:hypothetical protein
VEGFLLSWCGNDYFIFLLVIIRGIIHHSIVIALLSIKSFPEFENEQSHHIQLFQLFQPIHLLHMISFLLFFAYYESFKWFPSGVEPQPSAIFAFFIASYTLN